VRPGFPNPLQPGDARWRVEVIAQNIGPAGCTFNGFVVKFSDPLPTKEDFDTVPDQGQWRSTSTILLEVEIILKFLYLRQTPMANIAMEICDGKMQWGDGDIVSA
jgi:hypothetical protein